MTSHRVITQIIYQTIEGDRTLCSADSYELKRYGLTTGLTNYAAAYATGFLLARRLLKQLKMQDEYKGVEKVTGDYYSSSKEEKDRRPFKAILDLGLVNTTTGNRVFGAMKGASDGGIYIPHSTNRFPGSSKDAEGEEKYEAAKHRKRIVGAHVDEYMKHLKTAGPKLFTKQFSLWDTCLKTAKVDSVEKLFLKIHDEIRKNPDRVKKAKKQTYKREHNKFRPKKLNAAQRRERVQKKIQIELKKLQKGKGGKTKQWTIDFIFLMFLWHYFFFYF